MKGKVVFIGNIFGGDDGIGPHLYKELKNEETLKEFSLEELGVIGFDLLDVLKEEDEWLIIVDAIHDKKLKVGDVKCIEENELNANLSVVSMHDFGIEQTATLLKHHKSNLKNIWILGIVVKNTREFCTELSEELKNNINLIKEEIINKIIKLSY